MRIGARAALRSRSYGVLAGAVLLVGCGAPQDHGASQRAMTNETQRATPMSIARHVAGARIAAATGDRAALRAHIDGMSKDILHDAHVPDPSRPIPREVARARTAQIAGVRSVVWVDHDNLLVLVGGARYRDIAMIDRVCDALAPLGDTLGVVVNVQDVTATTSAGADAVSRDCQLPEGQRAFLQPRRQIEALDPALRQAFEAQQRGR